MLSRHACDAAAGAPLIEIVALQSSMTKGCSLLQTVPYRISRGSYMVAIVGVGGAKRA